MKEMVAALLIYGIVAPACSANVLPEETHLTFGETLDTQIKRISEEAIQAGLILREVAQELSQGLVETDEYFFRALWETAKDAVKTAGTKIGSAAKDAVDDLTTTMKKVGDSVKEKARETALDVLGKILNKVMNSYAADEFETKTNSVEVLCKKIAEAGERLIEEGRGLISN